MLLDPESCYRALTTHDPRFDGRMFVGVASTGVYCRPVCPARRPRRENCRFYVSAAAAERDGFRPCLRCRPELAPGNASVDAQARLAQAAASLIEDGLANDSGLDAIATRLTVTDRHLRRVFQAEFGVTPVEYAQTQRLLLAKRLADRLGAARHAGGVRCGLWQPAALQRPVQRALSSQPNRLAQARADSHHCRQPRLRAGLSPAPRLGRAGCLSGRAGHIGRGVGERQCLSAHRIDRASCRLGTRAGSKCGKPHAGNLRWPYGWRPR